MNRQLLKKLALASYTNGKLDERKVNLIVKYLKRSEFKYYLRALKNLESTKTVYIQTANELGTEEKKSIKSLYGSKNLVFTKDRSLIAGIRIIDNDMIYENNLKNNLKNLVNAINK